jgi:hypothetical protein
MPPSSDSEAGSSGQRLPPDLQGIVVAVLLCASGDRSSRTYLAASLNDWTTAAESYVTDIIV